MNIELRQLSLENDIAEYVITLQCFRKNKVLGTLDMEEVYRFFERKIIEWNKGKEANQVDFSLEMRN